MDKRGIFVVLVLLLSLISVGYIFGFAEEPTLIGPCPGGCGCYYEGGLDISVCNALLRDGSCSERDITFCADEYTCVANASGAGFCSRNVSDGDLCTINEDCIPGHNCYNPPGGGLSKCRSNSYWIGDCEPSGLGSNCFENYTGCNLVGVPVLSRTCGTNYYCNQTDDLNAACVDKKLNGQLCGGDYECRSGNCDDGVCNVGWLGFGYCPARPDGSICGCDPRPGFNACQSVVGGACTSRRGIEPSNCAEGMKCVNDASGRRGACVRYNASGLPDGASCTRDNDCMYYHCYTTGGINKCASINSWIGSCDNGGDGTPRCLGDHFTCLTSKADTARCSRGFYCGTIGRTPGCVGQFGAEESCLFDYECLSGDCVDGGCTAPLGEEEIPPHSGLCGNVADHWGCAGANNSLCVKFGGVGEPDITEAFNCEAAGNFCDIISGVVSCVPKRGVGEVCAEDYECRSGACDGARCVDAAVATSEHCGSLAMGWGCSGDKRSCILFGAAPPRNVTCAGGNYCREDVVSNSVDCVPKLGVGADCAAPIECASGNCTRSKCVSGVVETEEREGDSCSDLGGIVCSARSNCIGARSERARELNCCLPSGGERAGCRTAPILFGDPGSMAVVFNKECVSPGMSETTVVYADNRIVPVSELASLGVSSNPYTEQDYGCGGLDVPSEGRDTPGYGFMALAISFILLTIFYFSRNRKVLKY